MGKVIENREKIEWFNYWIEDANVEKKRILLIGDSVTRALRKKFNAFINDVYAVDLIAMSYNLLDDIALEEIKHFFSVMNYQYEYVFFQLGGHHGWHVKCNEHEEEAVQYKNNLSEILAYLAQRVRKVIAVSYTLENEFDMEGNQFENYNEEIIKRNELMRIATEEVNVSFYDLNARIDYKKITYTDRCHFHEEWYEYISKLIMSDWFFQIDCCDSQRIFTFEEFRDTVLKNKEKVFYIYGNGKRGKLLKKFLENISKVDFGGFIVSEEYIYLSEDAMLLEKVSPRGTIIIVTPIEAIIWKKVSDYGFDFFTLSSVIYEELERQ